jgi:predicted transcriptional regulator
MISIDDIKRQRQRLGLSQWALATKVGRTGAWLSLREMGYVKASPGELEVLAEVLKQADCRQPENQTARG